MKRREAERLLKRISKKADWVNNAMNELEKLVKRQERQFAIEFYAEIVKLLDLEDGQILNNPRNRSILAKLNKINNTTKQKTYNVVVKRMYKDLSHIVLENTVYYGVLAKDNDHFKPAAADIKKLIFQRLGFNLDGTLIREGYMQSLFESQEVTMRLKDYVSRAIFSSSGFESFKNGLFELIQGVNKMGLFSRFYRNYAYDIYSQTDALQGKMFAEELDLKYFIYNGGLIETSRKFCIRKNGNVFSTKDAQSWESEPDNKAKPPNYDPLIHRGGYGCRHSLDYITEEMAKALGYNS